MNYKEVYEQVKDISGWLDELDVEQFSKLDLPDNATILELGTFCGKSTRALQMLFPTAEITTCDTTTNNPEIEGVSFQKISSMEIQWDKEIDLLFVDSSHDYEGTVLEIKRFKPFIKKGGYIVLHDYYLTGVGQAVDEMLPESEKVHTGDFSQAIWRNE